jgi:hypothetical protein
MKGSKLLKPGFALVIVLALMTALILPAFAAGQPVLKIASVSPGSMLSVRVDNLPANTTFAVTMKQAGSSAAGGLVAHFESGAGGTQWYSFEIHTDVRSSASVEVRIDSGTGYAATAVFDNTSAYTAPAATAVPTTTSFGTGGAVVKVSPGIRLVHVQKGGWVQVELRGMPANEEMAVTFSKAGSAGLGGEVMAHLNTGTMGTWTFLFEIPVGLSKETSLDVRVAGASTTYVLTFANVDK